MSVLVAANCGSEPAWVPDPADAPPGPLERPCNTAPAAYVPGGGNVEWPSVWPSCVVDVETGEPIAGVVVSRRDGTLIATTNAFGWAAITVDEIGWPLLVGDGYVPTTWAGQTEGTTIPLERAQPRSARLHGTLDGWDALPAPAPGHRLVATVTYSTARNPWLAVNRLAQDAAANVCVRDSAAPAACAWSLRTRTGRVVAFATVVELDADDQATLVGYAAGPTLELADGDEVSDVVLAWLDAAALDSVALTWPEPVGDLTALSATALIDLDTAGVLEVPLVAAPLGGPAIVPARLGDRVATYHIRYEARPPGAAHPVTWTTALDASPAGAAPDRELFGPLELAPWSGDCHGRPCWAASGAFDPWNFTIERDGVVLWNVLDTTINAAHIVPSTIDLGGGPVTISARSVKALDGYEPMPLLSLERMFARPAFGGESAPITVTP